MTPAFDRPLRAGVIGAGSFGGHHARKYAQSADCRLTAVFDPDPARAQALAHALGAAACEQIDSFWGMVDIVSITSPALSHAGWALAALEAGKSVLIEKPLAIDLIGADQIVGLAQSKGLIVAVGHQERLVVDALGLFALPLPERLSITRLGPGTGRGEDVSVTLDLMIHDLDLLMHWIRQDFDRRATHFASGQPARSMSPLTISDNPATPSVRFHDHRIQLDFTQLGVDLHASRRHDHRERRWTAHYDGATLAVDFLTRQISNDTKFLLPDAERVLGSEFDPLGLNLTQFVDCVLGRRAAPVVSGAQAREALALALAIDQAIIG